MQTINFGGLSIFLTVIFFTLNPQNITAEKIKIKGLDIQYNEKQKTMVASGNAQLIHPEFTINADTIKYNQDTGDITGKNNVELQQSNQLILSNQFNYNTKTNIIQIDDLLLELTTPKNQQVYSKATQFIDESNVKKGKMAFLPRAVTTHRITLYRRIHLLFTQKKELLDTMLD